MTESPKLSLDIIRELLKATNPKDPRPRALPFPQSDIERVFRMFDFKPVVNAIASDGNKPGFINNESELLPGVIIQGRLCFSSEKIEYTAFPKLPRLVIE